MRSGIAKPGKTRLDDARDGGEAERGKWHCDQSQESFIFTSDDRIFLPTYSGVRPIMSPARKTATTQNSSMPKRRHPS